jgi:CARDB protein
VRRVVVLGVAILATAFAPAGAEAKCTPTPKKPDLKVTAFEVHLSNPAYAVIDTDGVLEPIEVKLTTKNQGNGTACPSVTAVFFQDSARDQFVKLIQIPALKPHRRSDNIVEITGAKPALGFALLGAHVDNHDQNNESDESNNLYHGPRFAIIAKEWDAKSFDVTSSDYFVKELTFIGGGFKFVLSKFDHSSERWIYKPYGPVTNQVTESGVCTASSNEKRTHDPWQDSQLEIAADLGGYLARVRPGPSETYSLSVSCYGAGSHSEQHTFPTLDTFVGYGREPTMRPNQSQLSDSTTDSSLKTTWTWDFRAALGQ